MTRTSTTTERLFEATKDAAEIMFDTTVDAQEQGWRFVEEMEQQARRASAATLAGSRIATNAALDLMLAWNGLALAAVAMPFSFAAHQRSFEVVSEERAGPKDKKRAA